MIFWKISTLLPARTNEPVPEGTAATVPEGSPKLRVLLAVIMLLKTRTLVVPSLGCPLPGGGDKFGSAKMRLPPALAVALLPYTSAFTEDSISMPATLFLTVLLRTMMLKDWPT